MWWTLQVGLSYAFQSEKKLYYVMEYVPGGELFTRLLEEGVLPVKHVQVSTLQKGSFINDVTKSMTIFNTRHSIVALSFNKFHHISFIT